MQHLSLSNGVWRVAEHVLMWTLIAVGFFVVISAAAA
jgi:hypothetical protein